MMRVRLIFFAIWLPLLLSATVPPDTVLSLPQVEVVVTRTKQSGERMAMTNSLITPAILQETQAATPKDISALLPGIHMPEYGSAMTSSIYIRGLGSRINDPVLGMVVDGVPMLNKNMYDHTMQDVSQIAVLSGPQGSLYGRNSMGGVMEIHTIQPLDLSNMSIRGKVTYGTANTVSAQASCYRPESSTFGWGVATRYGRTDGFYTNACNGRLIDDGKQAGGRLVLDWKPTDEWRLAATVYGDWLRQGAFPYANARTGQISFNSPASYERMVWMPSLRADYQHDGYRLQMAGSFQYLNDRMRMDQDYTPRDIFTLEQKQRQLAGTLDAILFAPRPCKWYEWQAGVSGFVNHNTMEAPVTFLREGIDELILDNANRGLQTVFPDDSIDISNAMIPIRDDFKFLNGGGAVWHQSRFLTGRWRFCLGLRLDYEHTSMRYLSESVMDYRFTMVMSDYKNLHTRIEGKRHADYLQLLPRLSVAYEAEKATLYACAAKGYKAGGYNPQIFSTVTQNVMMNDLAADLGMHLNIADERFTNVDVTSYRPETAWNFEIGTHIFPVEGLRIDAAAYHIQCFDQQLTVFPDGKATGRMMANAARSRVWGFETSLQYRWQHSKWSGLLLASYGFTDARFISFDDGINTYDGRFVPYAPHHTAHLLNSVRYMTARSWLQFVSANIQADGAGRIWWNEQNDCSQSFYMLLAPSVTLGWKHAQLRLWAKNVTNRQYDVFWFRSMGNDFLQRGKPREMGVTMIFLFNNK